MTDKGSSTPQPHGADQAPERVSAARASTDEAVPGQATAPANAGTPPKGEPQDSRKAAGKPVEPAAPSQAEELAQSDLLHRTRASIWYIGLIIMAILLILLMIFIGQNLNKVTIHFLGLSGQVSIAIALVIAAVAGILLVAIPGGIRMMQLRKRVKGLSKAVLKP
ncbi:lipopolysaccharide assembly protein LapA domain-containing protein [Branchiibius cervicis]|uniref:Lipopolysaccharide assembly protein LapA domain-containing protein n=1 Tax=Branchiibius cervicis TaxID=908252 RepID=A0ABW2AVK1_9MICO